MKNLDFRALLTAALLLITLTARAQPGGAPGAGFRECATPPPTPAQWQRMRAELPAVRTLQARAAQSLAAATTLIYVPLKLHVVRDDNGTAGTATADIYRALVGANERFAAAGVQFYACGQLDYVDDSTYLAFNLAEEAALANPRGTTVLLETKGADRDNSDSEAKRDLGAAWAAQAGPTFRYLMVFQANPLPGTHDVAAALAILRKV